MIPLSLIDLCTVYEGESPGVALRHAVDTATSAERLGYHRILYTEHHNMAHIASSSPAVLISHVAAHTSSIRVGAGGVMLPNHAPYVIAEQFGTLAELYPGRIDLGLGRAPGTDMNTLGRALRRTPNASDHFPQDVAELQGYLQGRSRVPGVQAVPGAGTNVPLIILGSSLNGATLAAQTGLPYAFASHFAPKHLLDATHYYREHFTPTNEGDRPHCIAAVNVVIDDTKKGASEQMRRVERERVRAMVVRGMTNQPTITEQQLDGLIASPQGKQIIAMLRYTAVGTAPMVVSFLEEFAEKTQADELLISFLGPDREHTMASMELLAEAWNL